MIDAAPLTDRQRALLYEIVSGKKVCPMPPAWNEFYQYFDQLISEEKVVRWRQGERVTFENLPLPMILAGWDNPDFLKNKVFQNQIRIIDNVDLLTDSVDYLLSLEDYNWHKSSAHLDTENPYSDDFRVYQERMLRGYKMLNTINPYQKMWGDYIQEDVANHRKVYNNFAQTVFLEEDQIQEWPQGRYKEPRPSLKKRE
jgi:hypothetical protein